MQSTGQTSTHASQPVQLSAQTTASSLGSFLRAFPAPLAMSQLLCFGSMVPLLLYEVPARGALVGQVSNLPAFTQAGYKPALASSWQVTNLPHEEDGHQSCFGSRLRASRNSPGVW